MLGLIAFALMLRTPKVTGLSMSPEIDSGEYVLIDTLTYRISEPKRGEIVAFRHDRPEAAIYLKRVIGLPGDQVRIDRGWVFIDGRRLDEPYVRFHDGATLPETVVGAQQYYVLGDNRQNSDDSRDWGAVQRSDIVGRALFGIWPLSRAGAL